MKLLTFSSTRIPTSADQSPHRLGAQLGEVVIDLSAARTWGFQARGLPLQPLPETLYELIRAGPAAWQYASSLLSILEGEDPLGLESQGHYPVGMRPGEIHLAPPLPRPMSLRDFYAFEQHVVTAHKNRDKQVPAEWYQFPVFYFSNPNAIFGPDETIPYPSYTQALDYELEVACIIGKAGINISSDQAADYIFGYTIFNDWSARDVQRQEMRVGLGPAKGKDFASSIGPWIVTPDELEDKYKGRPGVYDLEMVARVNGEQRSHGNWKDLHYSFGEMIARASQDTYLLPGDMLGSGTVGTGCLLELTQAKGPWLQTGDVVSLEIESLGVLVNRIGKCI